MKIKANQLNVTYIIITVIVGIAILGFGILNFISVEKQINSQQAQITTLQETIEKVNNQINILTKAVASSSAQIKYLLNMPNITPEVKYVPQQAVECPYPFVRTGGKCVNFYFLKGQ